MASTLKKMTGMGGDVRKIAALLQKKAPPGHKLAYINDEEAALLKSRGGSGKPHADTGIPSYELEYDIQGGQDYAPPSSSGEPMTPQQVSAANPELYPGGIKEEGLSTVYTPSGGSFNTLSEYSPTQVQQAVDIYNQRNQSIYPGEISQTPRVPSAAEAFQLGQVAATPSAPTAPTTPEEKAMSKETLARLGLAGGLGLIGASTARKAAEQGRAGAQQIQSLAAPYQKQGAELQAQAQRGELTPAAQQSLQAAQAQAAQQVQNRGGVGATQMQAQVETLRQQLLAQQYDYGLKLSGIGDNIALGAIKTGLEADRYTTQLNNSFYTNMAYIASGMSPGIRIGG